jgi:hypothetical protein
VAVHEVVQAVAASTRHPTIESARVGITVR